MVSLTAISLHLQVGDGWEVESASIRTGSAIALVVFHSGSGRSAQSRLDVGKRVFLDPLPVNVPEEAVAAIIAAIGRHEREDLARSLTALPAHSR